jgi:DNA-binding beta-propeller fold protein YncE
MRILERTFLGACTAFLALASSCADRERTNPFDPENPDTGGSPFLLQAIAGDGEARLSWEYGKMHDLEGYHLVRSVTSGDLAGDSVLFDIEAGRTSFVDAGLTNGTTYLYELAFVFGGTPTWTNSDTVTPGTAVPWVLDGYAGTLVRLSPDGRDRVTIFSTSSIFSGLDVVESDESAWVADYFNRKAFHVEREGHLVEEIDLSGYPISLVVDEARTQIWVSESSPASLVRYSGGLPAATYSLSPYPVALAVDETTGDLWACSSSGGWVAKVEDSGLITADGFASPRSLAFDHANRVVWVATSTEVVKLDTDLQVIQRIPDFARPEGIAVDSERGNVWVADTGNARVVKLSSEGLVLLTVTGLGEPYSIAVDALKEECWIADSMAGEVIRVSGSGEFLGRKGGFLSPFGIAVIP